MQRFLCINLDDARDLLKIKGDVFQLSYILRGHLFFIILLFTANLVF